MYISSSFIWEPVNETKISLVRLIFVCILNPIQHMYLFRCAGKCIYKNFVLFCLILDRSLFQWEQKRIQTNNNSFCQFFFRIPVIIFFSFSRSFFYICPSSSVFNSSNLRYKCISSTTKEEQKRLSFLFCFPFFPPFFRLKSNFKAAPRIFFI